MFKPLVKEDGKTLSVLATNSTAFTKYQGIKFTSGRAVTAASGDAALEFISLEAKTTGLDSQLLLMHVDPSIRFEVDLSAAITQSNVGTCIDINNGTHLDPTASTDDAFYVTNLVPGCNTKAVGYFLPAIAGRP